MYAQFVDRVNGWMGTPVASVITFAVIALDCAVGLYVGLGGAWGNVNGAATGFIGVQVVVLLAHSTNRGNAAIQLKLDVITRVVTELLERDTAAEEKVIGAERLTEAEIKRLKDAAVEGVRDAVEGAARYNGEND